jgi:enoyl-CoA hydratase/carnithine racemase
LRATTEAMRRLRQSSIPDDSDLIVSCYLSEDFKNGMEAFLAKEKPVWRGK